MKKNRLVLKQFGTLCISVLLFSCNDSTEATTEDSKTDDSSVAVTQPVEATNTPFKVMLIKHAVN